MFLLYRSFSHSLVRSNVEKTFENDLLAYFLKDSPLCIFDSKSESDSDDGTEGLKYQNLGCGAYTALSGIILAGLCVAFSRHQDCDADDFNWIFWLFGFSVITTVVG